MRTRQCADCPISIHALLAESDRCPAQCPASHLYFYPRSPCGERLGMYMRCVLPVLISIHALLAESDARHTCQAGNQSPFLSTLSLRRATWICTATLPVKVYFYPRSPCGERHPACQCPCVCSQFLSTLSLRRATALSTGNQPHVQFLSTLSLRRATEQTC